MVSLKNLSREALASLVDASTAINAIQDLDKQLSTISAAAVRVMDAESASVILIDPIRSKQVFRAAEGPCAEQLLGVEYGQDVGISGLALRTGEAMIVNDVRREHRHYKDIDTLVGYETKSLIAAPLIHAGEKLGVVEVINPAGREHFNEKDRQLAQIFANLAAVAVANAQFCDRLKRDCRGLKQSLRGPDQLIGSSEAIERVRNLIRRVSGSNATVLLAGETGTGKEVAARLVHANSPRAEHPFIPVNCAALPETLLESELFGHEAGAFTGATARKLGRFELADGGTIFLDEVGEIAPDVQVKLLRVLQEREIVRVGGTRPIGCDVRVIAATNRDLSERMRAGAFRKDLYFRLNVFPIEIPPLRERREDVAPLADHFLRRIARDLKLPTPRISNDAVAAMTRYDFAGNVRELQNVLERAVLLCSSPDDGQSEATIRPEHLPREFAMTAGGDDPNGDGVSALEAGEKAMVINALRANGWNQSRAARSLGISRDNIRYRIKKYGIERPGEA